MRGEESVSVLLIEDDSTWVLLAREMLRRGTGALREVASASNLDEGVQMIANSQVDVVLLDLNLPGSSGLATLEKFHAHCPRIPTVVLTESLVEELAISCLRAGADDYLPKSEVQPSLLWRVIRYAIERHRLRRRLEEMQREGEVRRVEQLAGESRTKETARVFASAPLRETHPEELALFAETYRRAVLDGVQARLYHSSPTGPAQASPIPELAQELGRLRCSPRDVLDLHMTVMKQALHDEPRPREQALLEEGRILVLNLMGHLAAFYRNYYYPSGRPEEG